MSMRKTSSSSEPRPIGRIINASKSSRMFVLFILKEGLYANRATIRGKVKHS